MICLSYLCHEVLPLVKTNSTMSDKNKKISPLGEQLTATALLPFQGIAHAAAVLVQLYPPST